MRSTFDRLPANVPGSVPAGDDPRPARARLIAAVPIAVSLAALAGLFWLIEWDAQQLTAMAGSLTVEVGIVLVLLFGLQQLGRAARLRILLSSPPPMRRLGAIVVIHQFCDYMLPLKTGELSLPELLARERVERPVAYAMLVILRGVDLLVATLLLLAAAILLPDALPPAGPLSRLLLVSAGALLLTGAVGVGWVSRRAYHRAIRPAEQPTTGRAGSVDRATRGVTVNRRGRSFRFDRIRRQLDLFCTALAQVSWKQLWRVVLTTLVISLTGVAFNLLFCRQLAPQLPWQAALLLVLMMPLLSQIPVRGWAGLGTSEAMLVLLFCLAGLPAATALSLAVCGRLFHFLLLAGSAIAAGWLYLRTGCTVERTTSPEMLRGRTAACEEIETKAATCQST